jgi:hypothetical protein
MTIRPFLSGRAFDPEIIDKMSEALKGVCETLSLKLAEGPETRLVAQAIIELAQRGVRDVATLQGFGRLLPFRGFSPQRAFRNASEVSSRERRLRVATSLQSSSCLVDVVIPNKYLHEAFPFLNCAL